jgi:hypothetical protein
MSLLATRSGGWNSTALTIESSGLTYHEGSCSACIFIASSLNSTAGYANGSASERRRFDLSCPVRVFRVRSELVTPEEGGHQ